MVGLGIGALVLTFSTGGTVGFTVNSINGVDTVHGGTSPRALLSTIVIVLAYLVALEPEPERSNGAVASATRRALAWFFDLLLSLAAISGVLGLIPAGIEAASTGRFQWQFERGTIVAIDWVLALVLVAATFVGMAVYWGLPVVRGGQTVGQAAMALRVVSNSEQAPRFGPCFIRGLMQPFAMLLWFTRFFSTGRTYFHDDIAHVRVITTTAQGSRAA